MFTELETIDVESLAGIVGGQDVNDYGDLSSLVSHGGEQHHASPVERQDRFLYGGSMSNGDRSSLIKGWEESNGRSAPQPLNGGPKQDW